MVGMVPPHRFSFDAQLDSRLRSADRESAGLVEIVRVVCVGSASQRETGSVAHFTDESSGHERILRTAYRPGTGVGEQLLILVVGPQGLEPWTDGLKVPCSACAQ
jgi:hypothetical protein